MRLNQTSPTLRNSLLVVTRCPLDQRVSSIFSLSSLATTPMRLLSNQVSNPNSSTTSTTSTTSTPAAPLATLATPPPSDGSNSNSNSNPSPNLPPHLKPVVASSAKTITDFGKELQQWYNHSDTGCRDYLVNTCAKYPLVKTLLKNIGLPTPVLLDRGKGKFDSKAYFKGKKIKFYSTSSEAQENLSIVELVKQEGAVPLLYSQEKFLETRQQQQRTEEEDEEEKTKEKEKEKVNYVVIDARSLSTPTEFSSLHSHSQMALSQMSAKGKIVFITNSTVSVE